MTRNFFSIDYLGTEKLYLASLLCIFIFIHSADGQYQNFKKVELRPDIIMSQCFDLEIDQKGLLWINSGHGCINFDGNETTSFTDINGLPSAGVRDILIDELRECVWILTRNGLVKFNGLGIIPFSDISSEILDQEMMSLQKLQNGNILILTRKGLIFFDGVKVVKTLTIADGMIEPYVRDIIFLGPDRWLTTSPKGLMEFSNGKFQMHFEGQYFRNIEIDANKNIYVTDVESSYLYRDGGLEKIHSGAIMLNLKKDQNGNVWVNDTDNLVKFEGKKTSILNNKVLINSSQNLQIIAFNFDKNGVLWFYDSKHGLLKSYEKQSNVIPYYEILDTSQFFRITGTSENMIIGYPNSFHKYIDNELTKIGDIPKMPFGYQLIQETSSGKSWVYSHYNGMTRTDNGLDESYYNTGSVTFRQTSFVFEDSKLNTFLATLYEMSRYVDPGLIKISAPRPDLRYISICEDELNQIFVGTNDGIFELHGDSLINCHILENKTLFKMLWAHDRIWVNSNNTRLFCIKRNGSKLEIEKEFSQETGFAINSIMDFEFLDSNLYITTPHSVIKLNPFLSSDLVETWAEDDGFFGSDSELEGRIFVKDSLININIGDGLFVINPNEKRGNSEPTIIINQIEQNHKQISSKLILKSSFYSNKRISISVPEKENNLRIYYKGIYHPSPSKLLYQYRLSGYDNAWSPFTDQRSITLTGIPRGKYLFEVRAISSHGTASEAAKLEIQILAPFYKSVWFLSICAILLGLSIYFWFQNRVKTIRRDEARQSEIKDRLNKLEIKALRAKMNPHFIFNSLSSIQHLIIEKDEKKALFYLNKFSKLIRNVLEKASDAKIELEEELDLLENYIELESLRFDAPFVYEIIIDPKLQLESIRIPYLIIQPFVENAIHHGLIPKVEKGKLKIEIIDAGNYIKVIVEDNGVGRKVAQKAANQNVKKTSFGISLSKERLDLLAKDGSNGAVKIIDLEDVNKKGIGTRVELNIPIISD